jgi:hypothetical protein
MCRAPMRIEWCRRTSKDIDRTLIRENLKLTVEERFRKAMALAQFAEELRRAGREARRRRG